ncbi:Phasin [Palleronia caenipelagi]|uniref:Phasin n=1 Tax=Palleronia caenipelagi TaxID=2489174 RepID=A0A547Q9M4_9RHOB|nr:Phasin [Palleronia caenipelagi]TRD23050.1 Phasin [Palleronia caenipelagi]
MATKTNTATDYTQMFQDMLSNLPMDMGGMQDSLKSYAAFGEKMSKVMLEAAEKSTDISAKYTKDTLAKLSDVAAVREDMSEYSKVISDFATAQSEATAETLAAYAEVAKKVQMETVELMLAAGKDVSEDLTAAAKKAANDATAATKRAASAK